MLDGGTGERGKRTDLHFCSKQNPGTSEGWYLQFEDIPEDAVWKSEKYWFPVKDLTSKDSCLPLCSTTVELLATADHQHTLKGIQDKD